MTLDKHSEDNTPLTWIGNFPVYLSTVLAMTHAATMALTAMAMACGAEALLQSFIFSSGSIFRNFAIWRSVTYAFIHFPPYWFFLLELYLLVIFGREIERYLGRWAFLKLYLILLLLPPLALTAAGALGIPSTYAGSSALHFGVFVAFAVLCPTVEIFFNLQARWVAGGLFAVNALQCLAFSDFISLGVLMLDCAAAYLAIENLQGKFQLPRIVKKRLKKEESAYLPPMNNKEVHKSIDPILDKISRSGMASLTARERQQLERARAALEAQNKSR